MAFNNIGSFFIAPGASIRLRLWWPAPGDHGAQWIMAHADRGQPPCELVVSDHAKKLDYSIGWVNSAGQSGWENDSYYYEYRVTVRNRGSYGVRFSIQGGGNT
jgi:hypothetical protein